MISQNTHVQRKTVVWKKKKKGDNKILLWNRNNWISLSYPEQICGGMYAWYLWAFHGDKKEFMCDQSRGETANETSLYLLFRGFFFYCYYCNTLSWWGVWTLNHFSNWWYRQQVFWNHEWAVPCHSAAPSDMNVSKNWILRKFLSFSF